MPWDMLVAPKKPSPGHLLLAGHSAGHGWHSPPWRSDCPCCGALSPDIMTMLAIVCCLTEFVLDVRLNRQWLADTPGDACVRQSSTTALYADCSALLPANVIEDWVMRTYSGSLHSRGSCTLCQFMPLSCPLRHQHALQHQHGKASEWAGQQARGRCPQWPACWTPARAILISRPS